ncbi:hypothetical protein SCUCBS95973_008494 [Sporothrix curviconia]|uniref:Autophagy-related protein 28 n=1 Tax=Sporothrix curviconia TaxID=1260050 RepID=A0ABP0CM13_9PEZI
MANSSFLSRFSLSRDDAPVLPLHTKSIRHQRSEYDLEELSPKPSHSVLFSASDADPPDFFPESPPSKAGPSSVSFAYQDAYRDQPSSSRSSSRRPRDYDYDPASRRPQQPVLFAGPPPPIARSMLMYRDVDDYSGSVLEQGRQRYSNSDHADMSSTTTASIRLPANTVLLDPRRKPVSTAFRGSKGTSFDGDSTWTILQRRERALQQEIQVFLDAQSAGLLAGLGRGPLRPGSSPGPSSDGGYGGGGSRSSRSNTPTAESVAGRSRRLPSDRSTATGAIIPVRQPRPKKLGLRSARAGLARNVSMLADLKAEEDVSLEAALLARRRALDHLRRLSGRRSRISRELESLETDEEDPLTRELATLQRGYASTNQEIADAEHKLASLKHRKRALEKTMEAVMSKRESGLSGYRGALKEVDEQLTAVLRRPPIQPLDVDALGAGGAERGEDGLEDGGIRLDDRDGAAANHHSDGDDDDNDVDASAGMEFLRLLPERRTAEMAKFWWESEMRLLEKRRKEVGTERAALEEGGAVWQEAVQLVSNFEANLRKEMAGAADEDDDEGHTAKGKRRAPAPEERMQTQLQTMATVIKGLRAHLRRAEDKGWNLLICAIGAELEAFQEAHDMLRQALRDAGFEVEEDAEEEVEGGNGSNRNSNSNSFLIDTNGLTTTAKTVTPPGFGLDEAEDSTPTPKLARSTSGASVGAFKPTSRGHDYITASESDDNDVPPDLLVAHERDDEDRDGDSSTRDSLSRHNDRDDSSENEVPPEFLSEHQPDDDVEP